MQHLSAEDFYRKTPFNVVTQNQIWMSQISDSHDNFCHCYCPFAHLLASIFPPGHKDRDLTINQILQRDYKELCRSGGEGEESHGLADGKDLADTGDTGLKEDPDDLPKEEIEELLTAAANADTR